MRTGSVAETGSPLMAVCRGSEVGVMRGEKRDGLLPSCWFTICIREPDPNRHRCAFCNPCLLFVIQLRFLASAEMFDITTARELTSRM